MKVVDVENQFFVKKFSLSTPRRHTGGAEVQLHSFVSSALNKGEWSTSRSGGFTPVN